MKKLSGLIIILAVLLLAGYYGMGVMTEKTLQKHINTVNDPNGLTMKLEDYKRGWFTSQASMDVKMHIPAHSEKGSDGQIESIPAKDFQTKLPITIHHGPIIFDNGIHLGMGYANSRVDLPPEYDEKFKKTFTEDSEKPHLDLSVLVNYLNQSTVKADVPKFKMTSKEDHTLFDWKGLESSTLITPNMQHLKGDVVLDGFEITKDAKTDRVVVGKIALDYDMEKMLSGLYTGDSNASMESIEVVNKGKSIIVLKDLSFYSDAEVDDHAFNAEFKGSLEKIVTNDKTYGPGKIKIEVRNLEADSVARINAQSANLQGDNSQRQQALMAILPEISKLISLGPELELAELHFQMPEGTVEGNFKISLPKEENGNPLEIAKKVHGSGKFSFPAPVVKSLLKEYVKQKVAPTPEVQNALVNEIEQTSGAQVTAAQNADPLASGVDDIVAKMLNSGLIVQSGDNYVLEFTIDNGQVTINERPFTPQMLQFN